MERMIITPYVKTQDMKHILRPTTYITLYTEEIIKNFRMTSGSTLKDKRIIPSYYETVTGCLSAVLRMQGNMHPKMD